MSEDIEKKRKGLCRAFVGLVFLSILIFGLFSAFSVKTAEAENNYIDNIVFYKGADGFNRIKFFTKTTFEKGVYTTFVRLYYQNGQYCAGACNLWVCPDMATYTAGITYDKILYYNPNCLDENKNNAVYTSNWGLIFGREAGYMSFTPAWSDTQFYSFTETPTLTITYPQNNMEIAEAFNIQGSYTIPAGSGYTSLRAIFRETGQAPFYIYGFSQELTTTSGAVNIKITGLPKAVYDYITFWFEGEGEADYNPQKDILNINIVANIPYELPITQERPPDIFSPLSPDYIYSLYSNYATQTAFFSGFTDTLEPLILAIGDNLTFFSSQFNIANAKEAGEKAGEAVLLVRSYANNLNAFFNDLPIAQVLFLYVSLLVVVAVFRIVRLLLKLIPFT